MTAGGETDKQARRMRLGRLADRVDGFVLGALREHGRRADIAARSLGLEKATVTAVALAAGLVLAGCSTDGSITSGAACNIFQPIAWSKKDTRQTQEQVIGHNAAGKAACGWSK